MSTQMNPNDFKAAINKARYYVSMELKKHGIDIDTRLMTTISILTSAALKYVEGSQSSEATRKAFDNCIAIYLDNSIPF